MGKKSKILVISGGGIFGAIPARFLSFVGKQTPDCAIRDLDDVDCIAGASIGGILAAGYAAGNDFVTIDQVFQKRAKDCFKKTFTGTVNPLANHKYDNDSLDSVIKELIGDTTLGQVKKIYPSLEVVIACLNLTDDEYYIFDHKRDAEVKLADIGSYTSAAPSYFGARNFRGKCVVDSGLIEVFPVMTAVTTYHKRTGVPFSDMDVMAIGVGQDISPKTLTLSRYDNLSLLGIATDVIVPYACLSNSMVVRLYGENIGLNSFRFWNPIHTNGELDDWKQIPALIKECDIYHDDFVKLWNSWLYDVD